MKKLQSKKYPCVMTESRYSLPYKFPVITSNDNEASKSEGQATEDYLTETIDNKSEYENLILYVSGVLNYEPDAPINYWLYSNLENLSNYTSKLPTDRKEVLNISNNKEWPLFHSLATEKLKEKDFLFQLLHFFFWEQTYLKSKTKGSYV